MPTDDQLKSVLLKMDPDLHQQLKDTADHYGASVRGTILRYIRMGLEHDETAIWNEKGPARGRDTADQEGADGG